MKYFILGILSIVSIEVSGATFNCGVVSIVKVLAGPRHGSMMLVNNSSCGAGGWVCLDPDAENMSARESDRLYAFIIANMMANKKINVVTYTNVFSTACNGGYPVVEDVRTP